MTRPSWEECSRQGMTLAQAAEARSVCYSTAWEAAHRRGLPFKSVDRKERATTANRATADRFRFPKPSYDGPPAWVALAKQENRRMRLNKEA